MPKLPSAFAGGGLVRKTCGQPVCDAVVSTRITAGSSTGSLYTTLAGWKKVRVFPGSLHKFCVQFYPYVNSHITDVTTRLSPLSTALIIRAMRVKKENHLIGQRG